MQEIKRNCFYPWVGKTPWKRTWKPTPAILPGESHGQRSLVGYSPYGCTGLNMTKVTLHAHIHIVFFNSVQSLSYVWLFVNPRTIAHQASLSINNSRSLLKLMSIKSVIPSNHLILCHPLLLLPSIFPSITVFSNEPGLCIRWSKYWSFSFSINTSSEYSGLISLRMDWYDLLAIQGILKSPLQHHSSKASILLCSAFFIIQLTHPFMTTGKTIPLIRWTFVGKIMSLLFNMLSRLVITYLPRSKCLLISWLQSPSAVILEAQKIVCHCFHCFPIYLPWSDGTRCRDLSFLKVEL